MKTFTITSWNMNHAFRSPALRQRAWAHLDALGADAALLQEARRPDDRPEVLCKSIPPRRWGSAIVPYNGLALAPIPLVPLCQPREAHELDDSHPGCCMVADATLPDGGSLTLVSIYGLFSDRTLNGERYVPTTVHRILSDLTPILDTARNRDRRVIVGGDLNISPQVPLPDTRHHELGSMYGNDLFKTLR